MAAPGSVTGDTLLCVSAVSDSVDVNGRRYRRPSVRTAVVCLDGCDPAYLEDAFARNLVPRLADAPLERGWAGLRPGSPDGLPFLGPVPGVENTTPRGEFTLKKFAGRLFGAADASGTPSQLISRRKPPNDPFAPAVVPPPRSVRN